MVAPLCRESGRRKGRFVVIAAVAVALVGSGYRPSFASSSGGEGLLAFGRDGGIWVFDIGSGEEQLIHDLQCAAPCGAYGLAWSPDGSQLAFGEYAFDDEAGSIWGIGVLDLESGTPRHIADNAASPSWSPDGSQLAWVSGQVMISSVDSPNPTPVFDPRVGCTYLPTNYCPTAVGVSWSPIDSDALLVYTVGGSPCCKTRELLLLDVGAGSTRSLAVWGGAVGWGSQVSFDWNPSGTHVALALSGNMTYSFTTETFRIIEVADGSGIGFDTAGWSPIWDLSWSPNGNRIALACSPGPSEITTTCAEAGVFTILPVEGSLPELLAAVNMDSGPAWQPWHGEPVGLVDPGSGLWRVRTSRGGVITFYFGNPGDYPFVGDWDCDGDETPGLYRQSDGFAYLRNTNSFGVADVNFFFGLPGDIPIAGDFDGDGCDTLGIYRPSEGRVYISDTLGSDGGFFVADYNYYFGNPGDKPFTGDFDGDGIDTIGLHRESTGLVYFRNTHSFGVADNQFYFGIPGDRLVAGDWGLIDGVDTPAVFRPAETTFYFRHTNTQGNADTQFTWGQPTWLPIAGVFQPPG